MIDVGRKFLAFGHGRRGKFRANNFGSRFHAAQPGKQAFLEIGDGRKAGIVEHHRIGGINLLPARRDARAFIETCKVHIIGL